MYENKALKFEIMQVMEKEHPDYGNYFWCMYGMGGDCGFMPENVAQYIIHKMVTLYHGEVWHETDKLIWNIIDILSKRFGV